MLSAGCSDEARALIDGAGATLHAPGFWRPGRKRAGLAYRVLHRNRKEQPLENARNTLIKRVINTLCRFG
jgi:hypothetical protein